MNVIGDQIVSAIGDQVSGEAVERFVREQERTRITGLSRASWYRLERDGRVPRRIRIDTRTVAWRLSALQRWIATVAAGDEWREEVRTEKPGRPLG